MSPPPTGLDYPRWIAESLRLVARRALEEVDAHGLPAEHHFLITVRTDAPGVGLPGFLRKQYPEEITLVLENQFWDLVVDDEGFSVTLTFSGSRQRLFAPWEAVTAFADPPAQLALRFAPLGADTVEEPADGAGEAAEEPSPWGVPAGEGHEAEEAEGGSEGGASGEVVRIDRFRRRRDEDEDD
jgi:hypothetical protein